MLVLLLVDLTGKATANWRSVKTLNISLVIFTRLKLGAIPVWDLAMYLASNKFLLQKFESLHPEEVLANEQYSNNRHTHYPHEQN